MTCSEAEPGDGDWSGMPVGSRAVDIAGTCQVAG